MGLMTAMKGQTIGEVGEVFLVLDSRDLVLPQLGFDGDHGVPGAGPGDDVQEGAEANGVDGQPGDHGDVGEAEPGVGVAKGSSQLVRANLR